MPLPMRAAGLMSTPNAAEARLCRLRREIAPPGLQQPMRQTIGLERLEAFEIEQRLHHPEASGIAVGDSHDVGAEGLADRGVAGDRIVEGCRISAAGRSRWSSREATRCDTELSNVSWLRKFGHQEGRELRLAPHGLFRFLRGCARTADRCRRSRRSGRSNPAPWQLQIRPHGTGRMDSLTQIRGFAGMSRAQAYHLFRLVARFQS